MEIGRSTIKVILAGVCGDSEEIVEFNESGKEAALFFLGRFW
jgi:hypothetical protein